MESASKKKAVKKPSKQIVSAKVKDYSDDPLFIKKGKASVAFLSKHGFPKELIEKE